MTTSTTLTPLYFDEKKLMLLNHANNSQSKSLDAELKSPPLGIPPLKTLEGSCLVARVV